MGSSLRRDYARLEPIWLGMPGVVIHSRIFSYGERARTSEEENKRKIPSIKDKRVYVYNDNEKCLGSGTSSGI